MSLLLVHIVGEISVEVNLFLRGVGAKAVVRYRSDRVSRQRPGSFLRIQARKAVVSVYTTGSSIIARREISSTHDRFGHEDIWLAEPISIWHHAHNDVAQLLIKLVGMPLQVLNVSHMLPDVGKEIDSSQCGLLSDVIGAKGNG